MVVAGAGLGLLVQNLALVVQNAVPSRHMGVATSLAQFSRSIGGTIGVSVMGAILAAGLPAGAATRALGGGGAGAAGVQPGGPRGPGRRDPPDLHDRRPDDGDHARCW